ITGQWTFGADASVTAAGNFGINSGAVINTRLEVGGTASISGRLDLFSNASLSGNFEVGTDTLVIRSTGVSSSLPFETTSYASVSAYFGSGVNGAADCNDSAETIRWTTTGLFSCGTLTGGDGITITADDFDFVATELEALTWGAGGNASNLWTFNLSAGDPTLNWTQSGATLSLNFESLGYASASAFYAQAGTALLPSFTFNNDPNTGIYRIAADTLGFTTNGAERFRLNSSSGASVSYALEVTGTASISAFDLPDKDGGLLGDCEANAEKLVYDLGTKKFDCGVDQTGGGGGTPTLQVRIGNPIGTDVNPAATISFDANNFDITSSGSFDAVVKLDYVNGPASRTSDQTITGQWTFGADASVTAAGNFGINSGAVINTRLEVGGTASISGRLDLFS
ncbi:MAG: hypothetical protein Q7L55_13290, partial [Actinomycetota bacterium]|nr:hypothetical protein [Actinomycetota bacterium]